MTGNEIRFWTLALDWAIRQPITLANPKFLVNVIFSPELNEFWRKNSYQIEGTDIFFFSHALQTSQVIIVF